MIKNIVNSELKKGNNWGGHDNAFGSPRLQNSDGSTYYKEAFTILTPRQIVEIINNGLR